MTIFGLMCLELVFTRRNEKVSPEKDHILRKDRGVTDNPVQEWWVGAEEGWGS